MILIGQYDSPFVRRVAVTLQLYGMAYQHQPWSAVGDADRIAAINPLIRVPTLVMDDETAFTDSFTILQLLDHLAGPAAFLSRDWPEQGEALRIAALAAGVADKGVALIYDKAFRSVSQPAWAARLHKQVDATLALLDRERGQRETEWLFGDRLSHADIIIGTVFRFVGEALPDSFDLGNYPALQRHAAACEALPEFQHASQPYKLSVD